MVEHAIGPDTTIADIGSGTGLMTELLLQATPTVYGVEPNTAMRADAQRRLSEYPEYVSVNGTAEHTTLPTESVDMVAVGQALHWFDLTNASQEFKRVLRADGGVLLVWNERQSATTRLARALEELLVNTLPEYYEQLEHHPVPKDLVAELLGHREFDSKRISTTQLLDRKQFLGRMLSNSYSPSAEDTRYEEFVACLHELFDANQAGGRISLDYETVSFFGSFAADATA